jgi:hypothetical protein
MVSRNTGTENSMLKRSARHHSLISSCLWRMTSAVDDCDRFERAAVDCKNKTESSARIISDPLQGKQNYRSPQRGLKADLLNRRSNLLRRHDGLIELAFTVPSKPMSLISLASCSGLTSFGS